MQYDDLDENMKKIFRLIIIFFLTILTISALVIFIAIGFNYENMLLVQSSLLGGIIAVIAVVISGIGWFPNFVLWAWAFLTNSIVVLGQGSNISLTSVTISELPAWPWFGLIPTSLPTYFQYLFAIPIFIGILMAITTRDKNSLVWIVSAFFLSLVTSSLLALFAYLSSGSLGSNLLANFGVSAKEVFQRSMTWFLIGEAFFIILSLLWKSARERNKIVKENQSLEQE